MSRYRPRLHPISLEKMTKKEVIDRLRNAETMLQYMQADRMRAALKYWRKRKEGSWWRDIAKEEMKEARNWFWARSAIRDSSEKIAAPERRKEEEKCSPTS